MLHVICRCLPIDDRRTPDPVGAHVRIALSALDDFVREGTVEAMPAKIRTWRQELLDKPVGAGTVANAYRFLRAVMNTAVDDEAIPRNSCRIKGAGVEHHSERPALTVTEVLRLADSIDPRYRVLVLLGVFGSQVGGVDGSAAFRSRSRRELRTGPASRVGIGSTQLIKAPKTPAGIKTVALPR